MLFVVSMHSIAKRSLIKKKGFLHHNTWYCSVKWHGNLRHHFLQSCAPQPLLNYAAEPNNLFGCQVAICIICHQTVGHLQKFTLAVHMAVVL